MSSQTNLKLAEKIAFITGGNSGILGLDILWHMATFSVAAAIYAVTRRKDRKKSATENGEDKRVPSELALI